MINFMQPRSDPNMMNVLRDVQAYKTQGLQNELAINQDTRAQTQNELAINQDVRVDREMRAREGQRNLAATTSMIDIYEKTGSADLAKKAFTDATGKEAPELYRLGQTDKVVITKPDLGITFAGSGQAIKEVQEELVKYPKIGEDPTLLDAWVNYAAQRGVSVTLGPGHDQVPLFNTVTGELKKVTRQEADAMYLKDPKTYRRLEDIRKPTTVEVSPGNKLVSVDQFGEPKVIAEGNPVKPDTAIPAAIIRAGASEKVANINASRDAEKEQRDEANRKEDRAYNIRKDLDETEDKINNNAGKAGVVGSVNRWNELATDQNFFYGTSVIKGREKLENPMQTKKYDLPINPKTGQQITVGQLRQLSQSGKYKMTLMQAYNKLLKDLNLKIVPKVVK